MEFRRRIDEPPSQTDNIIISDGPDSSNQITITLITHNYSDL